jgi:hypothetical protein
MSGGQSTNGTRDKPTSSGKNSSVGSTAKETKSGHSHINPCLGHNVANKDPKKKINECISITYKDFKKLMYPKGCNDIPGLAVDFIKVMTLDLVDLKNFEKTMAHYRESGGFNGTLVKLRDRDKNVSPSLDGSARDTQNNFGRSCTSKKAPINSPMKQPQNITTSIFKPEATKLPYIPKHHISEPYTFKDHYSGGEFAGKILIKT